MPNVSLMSSAKVAHSVKGWSLSWTIRSGWDVVRVLISAKAAVSDSGLVSSRILSALLATVKDVMGERWQNLFTWEAYQGGDLCPRKPLFL